MTYVRNFKQMHETWPKHQTCTIRLVPISCSSYMCQAASPLKKCCGAQIYRFHWGESKATPIFRLFETQLHPKIISIDSKEGGYIDSLQYNVQSHDKDWI